MPPSVAHPNTCRNTVVMLLPNGDVAENVLHFFMAGAAGGFDATDAEEVSNFVSTQWQANLRALTSTGVTYLRNIVQDLRTIPYPTWQFDLGTLGTDASQMLAPQLAAVASLRTLTPGRSGRGRVFLSGFCEDSNATGGVIDPVTRTAILDWASDMQADITTSNHVLQWAVLSRLQNLAHIVDSVTVDNRWDVQRRRANRRI